MAYPVTNELVTLADVKANTNISVATYDTFISNLIPQICRAIETYCRRRFVKNTWTEWHSLNNVLITDNWPINNLLLLGVPYNVVKIVDPSNKYNFTITQTTSNNISVDPKFIATNTQTLVATEFLLATYTTLGALKTAVEAALTADSVTFEYQTNNTPITFANLNTLTLRPSDGKTISAGINYFNQTTSTAIGDVYRIGDNSDRILLNPNFTIGGQSTSLGGNYISPYTTGTNNIDYGNSIGWYNNSDLLIVYDSGYTTANVPQELKFIVSSIVGDIISIYDIQGSGVYKGIFKSEGLGDYNYELNPKANLADLIEKYASQLDYFKKKII
jgi:hypothetical protein